MNDQPTDIAAQIPSLGYSGIANDLIPFESSGKLSVSKISDSYENSSMDKTKLFNGGGIPLIALKNNPYYDNNDDFNIADNYSWTNTPSDQRQGKVPYIELREFEQTVATLYAQIAYWSENLRYNNITTENNPYSKLYQAKRTGLVFKLPYFESYDHNIGQTWETVKGASDYSIVDATLQFIGNMAKVLKLAPGTTINQPQMWKGPTGNEYTVSFTLFNTVTDNDRLKNQIFKRRLQMSTLHDQRTAILSSPPAIFEVMIPGIRHSPAAVIKQLSVQNIGQMNLINGENIPDAWQFDINILELINESRQILNGAITSKVINAMNESSETAVIEDLISLRKSYGGVFQ